MTYYAPEYLCIGHLCHDLYKGRNILGGTASYASLWAQKLGKNTAVLTSVGDDFEFLHLFEQVQFKNVLAEHTTLFENVYVNEERVQYLHQVAAALEVEQLPETWKKSQIVHIGPITDRPSMKFIKAFSPQSLIGITPQGWMREVDANKKVFAKPINWEAFRGADVLIMSEADLVDKLISFEALAELVKVLVITNSANPAMVFEAGQKFYFPAIPIKELDPTGAGDVFATGFLIKYAETKDIRQATAYGHAAASCNIESIGISTIASERLVDHRFEKYMANLTKS